ncbi:intraflagellar transport protein 74 homolog [Tachysurus ichikawai]
MRIIIKLTKNKATNRAQRDALCTWVDPVGAYWKEDSIHAIEEEIEREKQAADDIVKQMPAEKQAKYAETKAVNKELLQELAARQDELDTLMTRKETLEADLEHSQVKQEAMVLYERLHDLELRRDTLEAEEKNVISPQEERERLLKQVKEDNQEIASMERQLTETREKINRLTEELRQLDMDMEDHQGERTQKYKELQKKEEEIDAYLEAFDANRAQEMEHVKESQASIVALLELTSRMMNRMNQLSAISPHELKSMQEDLSFKETEMQKSQSTAKGLSSVAEAQPRGFPSFVCKTPWSCRIPPTPQYRLISTALPHFLHRALFSGPPGIVPPHPVCLSSSSALS